MKKRPDPEHDNMHNNSTWWEEVMIWLGASLGTILLLFFAGAMWALARKRIYWTTAITLIISLSWIWGLSHINGV